MSLSQLVTVKILDKEYKVACEKQEQEELLRAARHLDEKMREVRSNGKVLGGERIAVMAALNIAHEYLPPALMQRPKHGFSLPIYTLLRTDLQEFMLSYLNDSMLAGSTVLDPGFVAPRVREFLKGNDALGPFVWKTLMFQMWYYRWMQ